MHHQRQTRHAARIREKDVREMPSKNSNRNSLMSMTANQPASGRLHGFCIAGTHSGAGKTTVTLGLLAALKQRGLRVQPFKCGPDYIDPGYHRDACGTASRNLDTWMMGEEAVVQTFRSHVAHADAVVAEGVMGLFDGAASDSLVGSTAHVCKILNLPVILVVDAQSMARSIAALVHGFSTFEPGVTIDGVIANNVGSERHRAILDAALSSAGLPPLLGALPRCAEWQTAERHLGLIASTESGRDESWYSNLAAGIEKFIDLDRLPVIARPVIKLQNKQMPIKLLCLYIWRSNTKRKVL